MKRRNWTVALVGMVSLVAAGVIVNRTEAVGSDWERRCQEWHEAFSATISFAASNHANDPNQLYVWTGDMPVKIPVQDVEGPRGESVSMPDPVLLAEFLTDSRWVPKSEGRFGTAEETSALFAGTGGPPTECTALLYLNPPPETRLKFVCSEGSDCPPYLSCKSSEPSGSPILGQGFCACAAFAPPTHPGPGCTGTFTKESGGWTIDCSGDCNASEACTYQKFTNGPGTPLWIWCECS